MHNKNVATNSQAPDKRVKETQNQKHSIKSSSMSKSESLSRQYAIGLKFFALEFISVLSIFLHVHTRAHRVFSVCANQCECAGAQVCVCACVCIFDAAHFQQRQQPKSEEKNVRLKYTQMNMLIR